MTNVLFRIAAGFAVLYVMEGFIKNLLLPFLVNFLAVRDFFRYGSIFIANLFSAHTWEIFTYFVGIHIIATTLLISYRIFISR